MRLKIMGGEVAYFCDNYYTMELYQDIPVINFEKLKEIYDDYDIIVTPWNADSRYGISKQLEENNIPYSIYKLRENELIPRSMLYMNERFPQYFSFETVDKGKEGNYIPMTEQAKYKYLIDVRGYSWTDRVKVLFHLKRPIFLVDRPYKEWYFEMLVPWKHYIPIKEDLSDLVEAYEYMEAHPPKYAEICRNMQDFADKYLSPEAVLKYVRDICLKYGVKETVEGKDL